MKNIFIAVILLVMISSCAPGPVGAWNYSVTGTPQGDFKGIMTIIKKGNGYNATMAVEGGAIPFDKFNYVKSTRKTEGNFSFMENSIDYSAILKKDQLNGSISVGGMEFPFTATRKK